MAEKKKETIRDIERRENITKQLNSRAKADSRQAVQIVRERRKKSQKLQAEQKKNEKAVITFLIGMFSLPILYLILSSFK